MKELSHSNARVHERIAECNICEYKAWLESDPKIHMKSVHEQIKPFDCIICDYKATNKSNLKKHIDYIHKGIRPLEGSIFENKARQKSDLKKTQKLCS